MASFGSGFAQGMQSGAGLVQQVRDSEHREKQREREQQQWAREESEREQIRALGADVTNGVVVEGTDNSYDVAEAARFGIKRPESTIQRKKMSDTDIENRYGQIALNSGKMDQYMASRQRSKAFEREEADKVFGAELQKIAQGDIATLGKYAKEYNKDTTTPGMLTMIQGKPHYVNPDTGNPEPMSFSQIAQYLGASHAMGGGDWKTGASLLYQQQQYGDQRRDKATEHGFMGRRVANDEAQTRQQGEYQQGQLGLGKERIDIDRFQAQNQRDYQMGSLGIQRQKLAQDAAESKARAGAANQMARVQGAQIVTDANGNYAQSFIVTGRDGSIEQKIVPYPPGWQPPKGLDAMSEHKMAVDLMADTVMPGTDAGGKGGRMPTYTEALSMVRQATPRGRQAPDPAAQDADSVVKFLRSQAAGGAQKPAPQGAMPGRQENTSQAQRLRQMTLGGGAQ